MWKMYGTMTCPFCTAARKILDKQGIKYMFKDVSAFPAIMPAGHKTVPVIYNSKGELVGGHKELTQYDFS